MKKSQFILSILLIILVAILATWYYSVEIFPSAKARNLVKGNLSDPQSAIFKDVIFFPETQVACGYVNSKNRLGGYVGFTSFIVLSNDDVLIISSTNVDSARISRVMADKCPEHKPVAGN